MRQKKDEKEIMNKSELEGILEQLSTIDSREDIKFVDVFVGAI